LGERLGGGTTRREESEKHGDRTRHGVASRAESFLYVRTSLNLIHYRITRYLPSICQPACAVSLRRRQLKADTTLKAAVVLTSCVHYRAVSWLHSAVTVTSKNLATFAPISYDSMRKFQRALKNRRIATHKQTVKRITVLGMLKKNNYSLMFENNLAHTRSI